MLTDSHAHYYHDWFNEDRDELLNSMPDNGIKYILNIADDMESSHTVIEMAEKYDFMYAAVGIHPSNVDKAKDSDIDTLKKLASHPKVIAIGEMGLEYFHDDAPPKELQKEWYIKQLLLAKELKMPFVIHDREAHADTLEILKQTEAYKTVSGILHCFSGSNEMAKELVKMGLYIAFGGAITFKNAIKPVEAAKSVPLENLLIETDAPYLTPIPYRGKRNNSIYIKETALKLAEIKEVSFETITKTTTENFERLFNLK